MKKLMLLFAAGLMVGMAIVGCNTEDPWEPSPVTTLDLVLVSAPDTSTAIPGNSGVSFVWKAKGGAGEPLRYQWFLAPVETAYGDTSSYTSATYADVAGGDSTDVLYTFHVKVTDADGNVDSVMADFLVSPAVPAEADTTAPAVTITQGPAEGSFAATGISLAFAWEGDDGFGNDDELLYQYAFPAMDDSSAWIAATSATFNNILAADPAIFYVRGMDAEDNVSEWDSVAFVIKDASILYIDDYQWLDANGDVDHVKEREQKQFYRDALDGYAFAEWDVESQGFPDSSDLVDGGTPIYSTIIYAADSEVGTTSGSAWTYFGDSDYGKGYSIRYFLEQGGNLLLGGALALLDMTQAYPPDVLPGDFEFDWLGLDSTAWCFDYWTDFTWAVKDSATALNLPDSMKIDVAKNGDQVDYAMETPGLREEAVVTNEVIFVWGLNIDGGPTDAYDHPLGHITYFSDTPRTCLLCFDMFEMPLDGIRQTFQAVLTEFGE